MILQIAIGVIIGGISLVMIKAIAKFIFALQEKLPYHLAIDYSNNLSLFKKASSICVRDERICILIKSKYL